MQEFDGSTVDPKSLAGKVKDSSKKMIGLPGTFFNLIVRLLIQSSSSTNLFPGLNRFTLCFHAHHSHGLLAERTLL